MWCGAGCPWQEPERHPILAAVDDLAGVLAATPVPEDRLKELLGAVAKLCSGTGAQEARSVGGDAGLVEHVCRATALLALGEGGAGAGAGAGAGVGAAPSAGSTSGSPTAAGGPGPESILVPGRVLPGLAAVKALCVKHGAS